MELHKTILKNLGDIDGTRLNAWIRQNRGLISNIYFEDNMLLFRPKNETGYIILRRTLPKCLLETGRVFRLYLDNGWCYLPTEAYAPQLAEELYKRYVAEHPKQQAVQEVEPQVPLSQNPHRLGFDGLVFESDEPIVLESKSPSSRS